MRTSLRIIRKKHQHCKRVKITQIEPKHILPIKMVKSIGPNRKEKKSLGDLSYVRKGDIVHSWGQPKYCITLFFHCNTFADERLSADQIILREFNQCLWPFMKLTWLSWLWVGDIDFDLLKSIFWFTEINILIYWNQYHFHLRPSVKLNPLGYCNTSFGRFNWVHHSLTIKL